MWQLILDIVTVLATVAALLIVCIIAYVRATTEDDNEPRL